jgi:predicted glycosyltransferase
MKIWYDACTGKHVRYGVAIAKRLKALGHEVILTTRKHPDTLPLAEFLKEKFIVVGRYNPKSLLTRLKEGTRRQLLFCKIFERNIPDIAISHGSVDQCRVAFGLGKPIICTLDTPYAEAVNRLTLPLANYIIASKAIPIKALRVYHVKGEIVRFDGVDEVAWIKDFKPIMRYNFGKPLIVVRQIEEKAVYTKETVDMAALARNLRKLGNVVFLSRYHRKRIRGITVPKEFVDSASLMAQADLFIGAGGTITREAALQGTPAIVVNAFRKQHVNDFLARKGFPIFRTEPSKVPRLAEKLLGKKRDVKSLLARLENPVDAITNIVERLAKKVQDNVST